MFYSCATIVWPELQIFQPMYRQCYMQKKVTYSTVTCSDHNLDSIKHA